MPRSYRKTTTKKTSKGIDDFAEKIRKNLEKAGNANKKAAASKKVSPPRSTGGAGRAGRGRPRSAQTVQRQANRRKAMNNKRKK